MLCLTTCRVGRFPRWRTLRKRALDSAARLHHRSGGADGEFSQSEHLGAESDTIEHDLADQGALLCRAMKIGKQLDHEHGDISPADAAFLIRARDLLNVQAAPATGSSIVFTLRAVDSLRSSKRAKNVAAQNTNYIIADEASEAVASALAGFVQQCLWRMRVILIAAVLLSMYVACGKLLLDTRDAVDRDFGANSVALATEINHSSTLAGGDIATDYCNGKHPYTVVRICQQRGELEVRKQAICQLLLYWTLVGTFHHEPRGIMVEQWVTTIIGVLGNYLLPVLYGALGSLGFLSCGGLNRQLADCLLTPRDLRANRIRIMLGPLRARALGCLSTVRLAPRPCRESAVRP